ncbi:MAG: AgmX/PglI C-terminal domain-containing protein [Myxococcaceae bacterium]
MILFLSVMSVEIPKETSRSEFEAWVKDIAPRKREAIILPKAPVPVQKQFKEQPKEQVFAPRAVKAAPSPARVKALGGKGVLGLIGVKGAMGAVGDVFSENLSNVTEGKQRSELSSKGSAASKQAVTTGQLAKVEPKAVGSVLSIIARKNNAFTRCYERALRNNPALAGKIAYELSVSSDGEVLGVQFTEDTLRVKDVSDCIKGILLRLVFPAPKGGPAIFSSVLVFGAT